MSFCFVFPYYIYHLFLGLFGEECLGQFLADISYCRIRRMAEVGGIETVVAQVILYHFVGGKIEGVFVINQLIYR